MTLAAGRTLAFYEILAPLGAGAMGEVYRARDTRLDREVAIKVLPTEFARDVERLRRFEREAKSLASLNHPNIAQIFGVDQVDTIYFLVLELVEGETLEQRLKRGPLPPDDALDVCRQIADGLGAAHEAGVIHRDLKPANIRITPEGKVKLLDFGLAKPANEGSKGSSTDSVLATEQGRLLGTPTYMAPEQARGKPIDKRVDIWAFGCVLYECLTAKRAFAGDSMTDVLGAVLHTTPDLAGLPKDTPPAIRTIVERCLAKDRTQRLADISVVRFLLDDPAVLATSPPVAPAHATRARSIGLVWMAAAVVIAALATAGAMRLLRPATPLPGRKALTRADVILPEGDEVVRTNVMPLAISPDGTLLTFVGRRAGTSQLFLRALAEREVKPLDGTDGASMPFFSPDGEWIAFFAHGKILKISTSGAGLQVVSNEAAFPRGGTWADDDTIYFAPTNIGGIWKVPASGGTAVALTTLDRSKGEISHRWPQALPGGKQLLFTVWTGPGFDERQIVVQSIESGSRHQLVSGGDTPRYLNGHLVYERLDNLYVVPWLPSQTSIGSAAPLALPEHPRQQNEGAAAFAVSDGGTLAYLQGGAERYKQRVLWVDRSGTAEATPLPERNYESVALSPDGRRAVVQIMEGVTGLWIYDFARDTLTPFATQVGSSQAPLWTPDGARIVYRGTRNGLRNLFWKAADGTGNEERLTTKEDVVQTPQSVSPDGQWLVYDEGGAHAQGSGDIYALRLPYERAAPDSSGADPADARAPRIVVQSEAGESTAQISPDGHWLAYASDVSGKPEIYARPFPDAGPSQQVSTDGGTEPLWSRDGKELFFVSSNKLMAVDVTSTPTFAAGRPHILFEGRYRQSSNGNTPYSVSADGRRFLRVQQGVPEVAETRIEIVLNWFEQLQTAAPEK